MKQGKPIIIFVLLLSAFLASAIVVAELKINDQQRAELKAGKIVSRSWSEGGTQAAGWGVRVFNVSAETMWKSLCSFELYDDYIKTKKASRLVDEETKAKIIKGSFKNGDEVEKLFNNMKPNYRRQLPDGKWVVYSYQRDTMPWPISDRWLLLEITMDDKKMEQSWKRLAGNVRQDFGFWHIYPYENGKSLGELEIHLDADIPVSGQIVTYGMTKIVPQTMKDFEDMAKAIEGQNKKK